MTTVVEYPLDTSQLRRLVPEASFPREPSQEQLARHNFVHVQPTARPDISFGETVDEGPPEQVGGVWQQTWNVRSITLAEAKGRLADMTASLYIDKVTRVDKSELLSRGYVGMIQDRETRLKPKLDDVAARIQAASTIEEAKAIFDELRAAS